MRRQWMWVLGSLLFLGFVGAQPAEALPAFARREGVMCQICHFRVPELNQDGHAYLRRGLREEPPENTGAGGPPAAVKRPLGTPLPLELAKYVSVMGTHSFTTARGARPDFDAGDIDLWVAGPIDRRWSGIVDADFDIENGGADVGQGYGQFITRWSRKFGSGRFGQILPFAILLNGADPSMSLSPPLILDISPDTGSTWSPGAFIRGVEVGYVDIGRWNFYFGGGQPALDLSSEPDFVNHTDIYSNASYIFDPQGDSVTGYAYWGHAWLSPAAPDRPFHRFGVFGNVYARDTKVLLGYVTGKDEAADGADLDTWGAFFQPEYLISPRWAIYGRYDHVREDLVGGGSQTIAGPIFGVSYWAATAVNLSLEGEFLKATGEERDYSLTAQLLWVF